MTGGQITGRNQRRGHGRFAPAGAILALLLALGGPGFAQQPRGAMSLPAPRLEFTASEMALARAVADDPDLAAFYGGNGLRPVFTGAQAEARRAALAAAVAQAGAHGLPAARYADVTSTDELVLARVFTRWVNDLTAGVLDPRKVDPQIKRAPEGANAGLALRDFARADDPAAVLRALEPASPFYQALKTALAETGRFDAPPGTPSAPEGLWRPGTRDARLADLRARLAALGFDPGTGPADLYDDGLAQAVRDFQAAAGLPTDGVAGPLTVSRLNGGADRSARAILMAMERYRWLPDDLGARHIWVNLPEYTARVVQDGATEFETRTVIGKVDPEMETPEFSDQMAYIVANPKWNVPRSITVRDYLPRLRANPNAVAHLDVIDRAGRVIPRSQIDFSRYTAANFPYRLQQKPSDDNALGQVKFMFPNQWNIYLHDTPTRHLFNNTARAYSNGCIRLQRPLELAEVLLRGQVTDPAATFRAALGRSGEQWIRLSPAIPIHLVYFTTFPDETGRIRHVPDIYGRDARLWQALEAAGLGGA